MASRCDKPQINPFHPRPPYSHPLFRHLRNLHFSYLNQQRRLPMSSSPPPAPPSSVSERGHQAPPTMVQQQQQQHQQQQQQQQHSQQASQSSSTPTSQGGPTSHNANGGAPSVTSNGQQHYSLKWNNHQSHVLSAFDALLQNESLVDCTLVCDDTNIKAHKVVLSACSPYFQKIFVDNPGKHPIIVLKDVKGWEVQCIVDFMYKGETSVPEAQLQNLIRAAEGLRVRGLTSGGSESYTVEETRNPHVGYGRAFLPSPGAPRFHPHHHQQHPHHPEEHKLHPHPHHHLQSNQSSPMSLTHSHAEDRPRSPVSGSGPRRKQARPRRRSGDSIGNSSLDLSKAESPNSMGFNPHKSPNSTSAAHDDLLPENLSLKRPSSSPAINLVKMESLLEDSQHRRHTAATPSSAMHESEATSSDDIMDRKASPSVSSLSHHMDTRPPPHFHPSLGDHEANARVEALQALNFMAAGGGLPHFPHGHPGLPLPPHTSHMPTPASLAGLTGLTAAAAAASMGRPTSTPVTPSNYSEPKTGFEFRSISIDRTKMSEEEAFEHAIDMIQTRQMGFRKAADFFSVSKWKLYKTARKRGIYAEIKKQNQAQALTKVPSNVQHFADMGVYKQLKKKTHLAKDNIFPHLPSTEAEVFKASTNNNFPSVVDLQQKLYPKQPDDFIEEDEVTEKSEIIF
ncbi:protein jim lovell-like isoform X5 [Tigriopus californicus]|uniref:protein jim lovell-like isoform X5 n=1 Tax=Tigriopus californicus TaxID=6832 RepID=UPI0027D9EA5B|nr:protein jim lovell-like isoform X5 [Tigriopus californicus]